MASLQFDSTDLGLTEEFLSMAGTARGRESEPVRLTGDRPVSPAAARQLRRTIAYLRRVRLDGAHRDLRAADPSTGATVAAIAARWGFSPMARFTSFYREQYGTLPSHTLRS